MTKKAIRINGTLDGWLKSCVNYQKKLIVPMEETGGIREEIDLEGIDHKYLIKLINENPNAVFIENEIVFERSITKDEYLERNGNIKQSLEYLVKRINIAITNSSNDCAEVKNWLVVHEATIDGIEFPQL